MVKALQSLDQNPITGFQDLLKLVPPKLSAPNEGLKKNIGLVPAAGSCLAVSFTKHARRNASKKTVGACEEECPRKIGKIVSSATRPALISRGPA
jgi:hypothetical protein